MDNAQDGPISRRAHRADVMHEDGHNTGRQAGLPLCRCPLREVPDGATGAVDQLGDLRQELFFRER